MNKFKDFTRCVSWENGWATEDIFSQLWLGNKVVVWSPFDSQYMLLYYNGKGRYELIVNGQVVAVESSEEWLSHIFSSFASEFSYGVFDSSPSMFGLRIKGVFKN